MDEWTDDIDRRYIVGGDWRERWGAGGEEERERKREKWIMASITCH